MAWFARFANLLRRDRVDRDLEGEIQFHLEARTEEFAQAGSSPHEARQRALRQFGNPLVLREAGRDLKLLPRVESIVRDAVFGLRLCRRYKAAGRGQELVRQDGATRLSRRPLEPVKARQRTRNITACGRYS